MPATQVNPSLRRRLSDDARELLRSAFGGHSPSAATSPTASLSPTGVPASVTNSVKHLSLAERLQNFRGQIRLELPELNGGEHSTNAVGVRLRITVSGTSYLLRYQVESLGAEVSVVNKAGSITSWITTCDGLHTQLRAFLNASSSPRDECEQIASLIDILELLDLFDVFRASLSSQDMPQSSYNAQLSTQESFRALSDKNSYVFIFDRSSGRPLMVTQSSRALDTSALTKKLHMVVEDYVRFDSTTSSSPLIDTPVGIKSDVELMVDTAMTCFSQWTFASQQRVMAIFDVIDKDGDGFVSSEDVYEQLVSAGQSELQSTSIVVEMARLLCDASDPSEEFTFYKFCGFWVTMLADGYRVSDPNNELCVRTAFQNLFLGGGGDNVVGAV
ncbi:hypothetical protein Gpo141_00004219 [Globisporangium polare]